MKIDCFTHVMPTGFYEALKSNTVGPDYLSGMLESLPDLNVQIDHEGQINKRLRSWKHWNSCLRELGFSDVIRHENRAYLSIDDTQPENNILIATR